MRVEDRRVEHGERGELGVAQRGLDREDVLDRLQQREVVEGVDRVDRVRLDISRDEQHADPAAAGRGRGSRCSCMSRLPSTTCRCPSRSGRSCRSRRCLSRSGRSCRSRRCVRVVPVTPVSVPVTPVSVPVDRWERWGRSTRSCMRTSLTTWSWWTPSATPSRSRSRYRSRSWYRVVVDVALAVDVAVAPGEAVAEELVVLVDRLGNVGWEQQLLSSAFGPLCGAPSNVITMRPSCL